MKLYTMKGSRYGSRCRIQIAAKGISVEIEEIDYPVPESFRSINPMMMVPVLDTGAMLLPESQVICEYLEDRFPEPALRPTDAAESARMRLLIRLFEFQYDPAHRQLFAHIGRETPRDEDALKQITDQIFRALDLIASHIDSGCYAVGGALTLADCALMPPLMQTRVLSARLGIHDPVAAHSRVAGYYDATRADPHVASILDQAEQYISSAIA